MITWFNVTKYERGFLFRGREFVAVLTPGRHFFFDPLFRLRTTLEDVSEPRIEVDELDVVVASGALGSEALVCDLKDGERGLVFVDERLEAVLLPGLYAFWTVLKQVRVEAVDARNARVTHREIAKLLTLPGTATVLELVDVEAGSVGLFFLDGVLRESLSPGRYAFWKGQGRVEVRRVDLREQMLEIKGQDIMTRDKVTIRLNSVVTYRVSDPDKAVSTSADYLQAIYRDAQLALRSAISARELDALLDDKNTVAEEVSETVRPRCESLGCELASFGIRDVILPGEMKDLLNKVTEARKAAEANVIARREETAAIRSQLNTARLLESSPTLMRLRELEVLEKVAEKTKLNVVLGNEGLTDRVVKLL